MADTDFCLSCGKTIGMWDKTCRYCGANQFGDNNEFYPTAKSMREAKRILNGQRQRTIRQRKGLADEEILATGLYPKNDGYKMSLISRILGKK